MSKIEIYECDECGCVLDEETLRYIVKIYDRNFDFCHDCFSKSYFKKFYSKMAKKGKVPEVFTIKENLPINNGWDGKKRFLDKIIYKERKK